MTSPYLAPAVVIASAVLHAWWNALIKASPATKSTGVVVLTASGLQAWIFTLFLRGPVFPDPHGIAWSLLSGCFESAYFLTLVWCLSLGPLAQVYSFSRGGSLLFVWPLSIMLMGEPLVGLHAFGAATVFVGLMLTGLGSQGEQVANKLGYFGSLAICAGCIASYHLIYKKAMLTGGHPMAVFATSMTVAVPVNLLWHRRTLKAEWNKINWKLIALASTLCTGSFLLALAGLHLAGTGWVLTLRNCSVVIALLFAWRLGEKIPRPRVIGTVLIAIGAIILSWPSA